MDAQPGVESVRNRLTLSSPFHRPCALAGCSSPRDDGGDDDSSREQGQVHGSALSRKNSAVILGRNAPAALILW